MLVKGEMKLQACTYTKRLAFFMELLGWHIQLDQ